jgi:UrcA family protein
MKTTSKTALIATLAITGAFAAGFSSGPAFAQNAPQTFQFEFKYDAAELGSLDGANNLLTRLQSVVTAYCGANGKVPPSERWAKETCVERTMRDSIAKFASPTVAEAYETRARG